MIIGAIGFSSIASNSAALGHVLPQLPWWVPVVMIVIGLSCLYNLLWR